MIKLALQEVKRHLVLKDANSNVKAYKCKLPHINTNTVYGDTCTNQRAYKLKNYV